MRKLTKKQGLREEAKLVMWNYYKENKTTLPVWIKEYREDVIDGLMNGEDVESVFSTIVDDVERELELDGGRQCSRSISRAA
jgi:hypothetical protein